MNSGFQPVNELSWILSGGILMSLIALLGGLGLLLPASVLKRCLLPVVALAAGTLLGGAFFHIIPHAASTMGLALAGGWVLAGFTFFLGLEQFLHWHSGHGAPAARRQPATWLILIGDAIHNFVGGLAIATTFLINPQAGITAWFAAAAHEVPQELGDFGILVHGGWRPRDALLANLLAALTFPAGALLAWAASRQFDLAALALIGAGNFLYIAASDLVPEIKKPTTALISVLHLASFVTGLLVTGLIATMA